MFEELLEPRWREKLLTEILDPDTASIFGAEIRTDQGYYLQEGEGSRSLGTIKVAEVERFDHNCHFDKWDYRLYFRDLAGARYHLKVTDLSLRYYVDSLREGQQFGCEEIEKRLTQEFQHSQVYLRIGLARHWHPDHEQPKNRCYLQITGVYTFPDYLGGRCFADFPPQTAANNEILF